MKDAKQTSTPIGAHFELTTVKDQDAVEEGKLMKGVPYSNVVGSMMYAMVSTRPDIAYGVGLISRFISRLGRIH